MIEINGSSGGGQMLRTALSLAAVTGKEFKMENIRSNRSNPGLKRQHLEAVKVAGRLCNAETTGEKLNSKELEFRPQELENRPSTSNIGTAGSVTLLFDTVLPITTQFNDSFRFTVKGGTDVKWSPAFEYFRQVKMPLLQMHGMEADVELEKIGYYPKGGGEAILQTEEYSLEPIDLTKRGELKKFEIYSKASKELQDRNVADRQADEAERMLKNSHISTSVEKSVEYEKTASPGSSLVLKAVYENSIAGFDSLGERGKRSEEVAREVVQDFKSFHSTEAAADQHMADQLMVFLAIAGGEISIPKITDHIQTNAGVVEKFGFEVYLDDDTISVQ